MSQEELKEENQRLKEEYIMLQNASEEYEDKLLKENQALKDLLIEKDNQIEEIKQQKTDYTKVNILEMENQRLNNVLNELEEYIKRFLYMLNGILDRDIYEQCQLDDFTMIMEKLKELKESDK